MGVGGAGGAGSGGYRGPGVVDLQASSARYARVCLGACLCIGVNCVRACVCVSLSVSWCVWCLFRRSVSVLFSCEGANPACAQHMITQGLLGPQNPHALLNVSEKMRYLSDNFRIQPSAHSHARAQTHSHTHLTTHTHRTQERRRTGLAGRQWQCAQRGGLG